MSDHWATSSCQRTAIQFALFYPYFDPRVSGKLSNLEEDGEVRIYKYDGGGNKSQWWCCSKSSALCRLMLIIHDTEADVICDNRNAFFVIYHLSITMLCVFDRQGILINAVFIEYGHLCGASALMYLFFQPVKLHVTFARSRTQTRGRARSNQVFVDPTMARIHLNISDRSMSRCSNVLLSPERVNVTNNNA